MIESLFLPLMLMSSQPVAQMVVPAFERSSVSATEKQPKLTSEDRAALRCAAAFALVGARKGKGGNDTGATPELAERGQEFFIVTLAGMMDKYALDRMAIEQIVTDEAQKLVKAQEVDAVMPACLLMLQAAGL